MTEIASFSDYPSEKDLLSISIISSSEGNQRKYISRDGNWYYKQCFYYQERFWRDDLVEVIASYLGRKYISLPDCEVLQQSSALRFGHHGVFSHNFLCSDEQYIPFGRILSANSIDIRLNAGIDTFNDILSVYENCCGIDATDFLIVQTLLDYLVGNEDRHLHNFGVIRSPKGYRLHPVFDFGLGMFEHDRLYEDYKFRDKLELIRFKTFGASQVELIGILAEKYPSEFKRLTSWSLHPSEFTFPSVHAETYLRYACGRVGVEICND